MGRPHPGHGDKEHPCSLPEPGTAGAAAGSALPFPLPPLPSPLSPPGARGEEAPLTGELPPPAGAPGPRRLHGPRPRRLCTRAVAGRPGGGESRDDVARGGRDSGGGRRKRRVRRWVAGRAAARATRRPCSVPSRALGRLPRPPPPCGAAASLGPAQPLGLPGCPRRDGCSALPFGLVVAPRASGAGGGNRCCAVDGRGLLVWLRGLSGAWG